MSAPKSEKYVNLTTTTLSSAYTAGDGHIHVTSADGFPTDGDFRVRLGDSNSTVTLFKVTSISGTEFTGTAEGTDSNVASGKAVTQVLTAGALDAMRVNDCYSDTVANIPAAEKAGRLFLPTDQRDGIYRDNGSSWDLFIGGVKCVAPPQSGWYTEGSGSPSVSFEGGVMVLDPGTQAAGIYRQATAPYTATAFIASGWYDQINGNNTYLAMGIRDTAASTKWLIEYFMPTVGHGFQRRADYVGNSPNNYASVSNANEVMPVLMNPFGIRVVDDNTDISVWYSFDCRTWKQYDSNRSRTDYLGTPYGPGFNLLANTPIRVVSFSVA